MTTKKNTQPWLRAAVMSLALVQLVHQTVAQTEYEKCVAALVVGDHNGNKGLNKDPEYIVFLNELSDYQYGFLYFDDLPESLKMNFEFYQESVGVVDITAATMGEASSNKQQRLVETLCKTTVSALKDVPLPEYDNSTMFPTGEDTLSMPPTDAMEETLSPNPESVSDSPVADAVTVPPVESIEASVARPTDAPEPIAPEMPNNVYVESPDHTSAPEIVEVTRPPGGGNRNGNVTVAPIEPSSANITEDTGAPVPAAAAAMTTPPAGVNATNAPTDAIEEPEVPATLDPTTIPPVTQRPSVSEETSSPNATNAPFVSSPNATAAPSESETISSPIVYPEITSSPNVSSLNATVAPFNSSDQLSNETVLVQTVNETVDEDATEDMIPLPDPDPYAACKMVMKFSDINADGKMNKVEYVWFINDNWKNLYPGVDFQDLPQEVKDNFNALATEGSLDITAMNSAEEMSDEQVAFLDKVCADTEAVLALEPELPNAGEEATMATFTDCLSSIFELDENNDSSLDANEYVNLINQLSDSKFGKQGFNFMPTVLQEVFSALAVGDIIDMGGANQNETLSSSQQETLDEICLEASFALDEAVRASGEDGPKFDGADTDTMLEYASCFLGMTAHDTDGNLGIDQYEYVDLVNHMGKNGFQDLGFSELPEVIQENFFKLETNGTIDITGAQASESPNDTQRQYLGRVCLETTASINMGLVEIGGTEEDAGANTLAIHSSFNIFSDVLLPEEEFLPGGSTRETLEEAYKIFVIEVVEGLIQEESSQGSTQRMLQEITFDAESPKIYQMKDLNCAGSARDSVCKTVFAQYEITLGESADRESLYEEYVSVTQGFIDSGLLQRDMEQIHPDILISVIGASEPVIYKGEESTQSPVNSGPKIDVMDSGGDGGATKKTLAFVAGGVAFILMGGIIALYYVGRQKRLMDAENGSLLEKSSQMESDTDSKVDVEDEDCQQEVGSQASRNSSKNDIFRAKQAEAESDGNNTIMDEEYGQMQVVDLLANLKSPSEQSSWSQGDESQRSFPPLFKKKDKPANDNSSAASEELSFAFRRYALDGKKDEPADDEGSNVI